VGEGAGATLEVGIQHVFIQTVAEQGIQVRREIREKKGGVLAPLCAMPCQRLACKMAHTFRIHLGNCWASVRAGNGVTGACA
jgi:hypothetical protein